MLCQKIKIKDIFQSRRKLFYGGVEGLSKNVGHHGLVNDEKFKIALAKTR